MNISDEQWEYAIGAVEKERRKEFFVINAMNMDWKEKEKAEQKAELQTQYYWRMLLTNGRSKTRM